MPEKVPISRKRMEEQGLDPAEYPSCSKPGPDNVGCRWFSRQRTPDKDGEFYPAICKLKEKQDGSGPCNKGALIIKRGSDGKKRTFNKMLSCYHIPWMEQELELNKGLLKVIANEGETIKIRGSEQYKADTPDGLKWMTRDVVRDEVVPPYQDENTEDLMSVVQGRDSYERFSADRRAEIEEEVLRGAAGPSANAARVRKSAG